MFFNIEKGASHLYSLPDFALFTIQLIIGDVALRFAYLRHPLLKYLNIRKPPMIYKTGLTKGKTYYFKVAAYKTIDGTNIYGAYSAVKSGKIK